MASAPIVVLSNYSRLTSREQAKDAQPPKPVHATERELFEREISRVQSEVASLRGEKGVALALELLRAFKEGRKENETYSDYEVRTTRAGLEVLGLEVKE